MEHFDKEIISLIYEKEEEPKKNDAEKWTHEPQPLIQTLDGETYIFAPRTILNDRVEVTIPKSFSMMSLEQAKLKYPFEQRPDPIFTNEEMSINLTFSYTEDELDAEKMDDFKDVMVLILQQTQRILEWYKDGVVEIDGTQIGFCEFLTPALGTCIYNFMFFVELEGRVLIGSFNCTEEEMETWQPVAHQILSSFRILSRVEGGKINEN